MKYWLMKSEPGTYSFDDLLGEDDQQTMWDSIRNYQARNFMRDEMKVGDRVLFYHSNAKPPGVVGLAEVSTEPYPDPTQFDPENKYFDAKSDPAHPRWILVDIRAIEPLPRMVSLGELRESAKLTGMALLQKGQRLSIQPVKAAEYREILRIAKRG